MTVIDGQVHVWSAETLERPWLPGGAARVHHPLPLEQDDLLWEMDAAGGGRAIIIPPSWGGGCNGPAMEAALLHPEWMSSPTSIKPG
jgi:predicted TIM-barrel fold metal-dependent hydrolase